ncbi:permease prefix domain 1-containing protein [Deinococcus roseus]|uniref:Uncharacterized protein n=1 Tax=Deinococcus roseus TaxID=392414 RepID=A0ABQ2CVV7_9DEIO|nr:permease prefix domain 1-containing protein [Deinococcus roseus]GGJ25987.1 hypothetical protein GCM10008938_10190 [Deinococcus roseus]
MKTIDQYIHKATRGLPRKERIDAAAELRAHMIEKIKDLMQQGFSREEAAYLAVQEMGSPTVPFWQRFRHFAQYQLPYWVLGAVLLSGGYWWGKDNLFAPKAGVYALQDIGVKEMKDILNLGSQSTSGWKGVKVVFPTETRHLTVMLMEGARPGMSRSTPAVPQPGEEGKPNNFRFQETFLLGLNSKASIPDCPGPGLVVLNLSKETTADLSTCTGIPMDSKASIIEPWRVASAALGSGELHLNTWTPIAELYLPDPMKCDPSGACRNVDQGETINRTRLDHWRVLMVYASNHQEAPAPELHWNRGQEHWTVTEHQ